MKKELFPPHKDISTILDIKGFNKAFDSCWNKLECSFFKFERLQFYDEPEEPSYMAYKHKDFVKADQLLEERISRQKPFYDVLARKNISFIRVRAVEFPLSDYLLNYELKAYRISARYGEKILIADIMDSKLSELYNSMDFTLFDSKAVIVQNYNKHGFFIGGWLIEDPKYVERYKEIANKFIASAIPLDSFEKEIYGNHQLV